MAIYVSKNEQDFGPFEIEQLREAIRTGTFSPEDLAWQEGSPEWLPLRKVLPPEPPKRTPAEPSDTLPVEPETPGDSSKIKASLATFGQIAAKEALLRKTELTELKNAYFKLGDAFFRHGDPSDARLKKLHDELTRIDSEIATNSTLPKESTSSSVLEKAKRAGTLAKGAAITEALKVKRRSILADVGRECVGQSQVEGLFPSELAEVRRVETNVRVLKEEIAALESKSPHSRKILYGAVGLCVLGLVFFGYSSLKKAEMTREADSAVRQQQSEVDKEMVKIRAQIAVEDERQKAAQQQRANEAKLAEARRELERRKAEIDAEEKRSELQAKNDAERIQFQEDQKQRQLAAEKERELKSEEAEKHLAEEQETRRNYANAAFNKVPLTPLIAFSGNLLSLGASAEVKGKNYEEIQKLYSESNWLQLLSFLRGSKYDKYPESHTIDTAIDQLWDQRELFLLVKVPMAQSRETHYYLVTFLKNNRYNLISMSNLSEKHPDGIGYVHQWRPQDGDVLVVSGDYSTIERKVSALNERYQTESKGIQSKVQLAELDENTATERLNAIRRQLDDEMLTWSSAQLAPRKSAQTDSSLTNLPEGAITSTASPESKSPVAAVTPPDETLKQAIDLYRHNNLLLSCKVLGENIKLQPQNQKYKTLYEGVYGILKAEQEKAQITAGQQSTRSRVVQMLKNADTSDRPNPLNPNDNSGHSRAEQARKEAAQVNAQLSEEMANADRKISAARSKVETSLREISL